MSKKDSRALAKVGGIGAAKQAEKTDEKAKSGDAKPKKESDKGKSKK